MDSGDIPNLLPSPQKMLVHLQQATSFCLFSHQTPCQWWRRGQRWRGRSVWPVVPPLSGRQVFSVDLSTWSAWASTGKERVKGLPPYTPGSRWHHGHTFKHTFVNNMITVYLLSPKWFQLCAQGETICYMWVNSCLCAAFLLVHGPVVPGGGRLGSGAAPGGQGRAEGGVTGFEESRTGVQSKHRGGEFSGEAERRVRESQTAPRCRQQPATTLLRWIDAALWTRRP